MDHFFVPVGDGVFIRDAYFLLPAKRTEHRPKARSCELVLGRVCTGGSVDIMNGFIIYEVVLYHEVHYQTVHSIIIAGS